jgi:hypothetical protein
MTDGPATNPHPLDYEDGSSAAADRRAQGPAGRFSLTCFALFALAYCGEAIYSKFVAPPTFPFGNLEAAIALGCAGLFLLSVGILCGVIRLVEPSGRRTVALFGLVLNGSVLLLALAKQFG